MNDIIVKRTDARGRPMAPFFWDKTADEVIEPEDILKMLYACSNILEDIEVKSDDL